MGTLMRQGAGDFFGLGLLCGAQRARRARGEEQSKGGDSACTEPACSATSAIETGYREHQQATT